jgi:hypothetical protein
MSNCNKNITAVVISLLLAACSEKQYKFDITKTLNKNADNFFKQLPGIKSNSYAGMKLVEGATAVEIYRAVFKETTIEKDNLLEITAMNEKSEYPVATYAETDGFMQHMYLLKYNFVYKSGREDVPASAVVFLTLRYRQQVDSPFVYCTGPGPAYWGTINETDTYNYISFDSVLHLQQKQQQFYIKTDKRKKNKFFNLLFMPVNFVETPDANNSIVIEKIVRMGNNRIGGTKPIVFNIPVIFKDSNALRFDYVTTVTIKK